MGHKEDKTHDGAKGWHRSRYYGISFQEKKELPWEVYQQGDRRQGSDLSLHPVFEVILKSLGELQAWKLIG